MNQQLGNCRGQEKNGKNKNISGSYKLEKGCSQLSIIRHNSRWHFSEVILRQSFYHSRPQRLLVYWTWWSLYLPYNLQHPIYISLVHQDTFQTYCVWQDMHSSVNWMSFTESFNCHLYHRIPDHMGSKKMALIMTNIWQFLGLTREHNVKLNIKVVDL